MFWCNQVRDYVKICVIDDFLNCPEGCCELKQKTTKEVAEEYHTGYITTPLDTQVGGSHYKNFVIQPVEFCHKNNLGFIVSSAIKYLCRYNQKGTPKQDLEKAKHFIDLLMELEGLE
jgi:hypothetical protein